MIHILGYIAAIFMGLSLGMIGGGGSIMTIPILVYIFAIDPLLATFYSLFVVGIAALVGGLNYFKRGEVDLKTGLIFVIPSFAGVYIIRHILLPQLPDPVMSVASITISKGLLVMTVFSVLMLLASLSMIKAKKPVSHSKDMSVLKKSLLVATKGLIVGAVTGFVGAGGGFLIVPALVILIGMSMRVAVGTSLFIIAANTLFGFFSEIKRHEFIDWTLLLSIASIAVVGIFLGASFSKKVDEKTLKKGFGYFVLLMGAFVLFDQIKKL